MSSVVNSEWLNANSLRAYPIKEDCMAIPVNSAGSLMTDVRIPNYLLVDFVLTMDLTTPLRVYLKQLVYVGNLITFGIYDEADVLIALVSVSTSAHVANAGYSIIGTGTYSDVRGRVVLGNLDRLPEDLPEGLYNFTLAQTEFETTTIRPDLRGVRSLQISDQGSTSVYIYGAVQLVSGNNVRLSYDSGTNAIRIDAIGAEGLNEECACSGVTDVPVTKINGRSVDDVQLVGDGACITVTTNGNIITIADKCSKPCCGCPELEFITNSLKVLDTSVTNLQTYAMRLAERIDNFVTNYILTIR